MYNMVSRQDCFLIFCAYDMKCENKCIVIVQCNFQDLEYYPANQMRFSSHFSFAYSREFVNFHRLSITFKCYCYCFCCKEEENMSSEVSSSLYSRLNFSFEAKSQIYVLYISIDRIPVFFRNHLDNINQQNFSYTAAHAIFFGYFLVFRSNHS